MYGEVVNKRFNYRDIFDKFFYRNQVEYKNNHRRYPISVERNWATNYCHECCHACLLALTEVNENYLWWYLVDGVNVEPQLDFWRQLLW